MVEGETLPRVYTRAELLGYLDYCRERCRIVVGGMTAEQARRMCRFPWGEVTFGELHLYNMRHVQEHAAQLGMFVGQHKGGRAQ
jgi:hypothetical protein